MNKGDGLLVKSINIEWKPTQIYSSFQKNSPWKYDLIQEKIGYCWLISVLNNISYYTNQNYNTQSAIFSLEELIVYDKLEKAQTFLENIYKTRDLKVTDKKVNYLLNNAMSDHGHWQMAVYLIEKYGLIPMRGKEYDKNNLKTRELNAVLAFILRHYALQIRNMKEPNSAKKFKECKQKMMKSISEVIYSYMKKPQNLVKIPQYIDMYGKITPQKFYTDFIHFPFDEYVCLMVGNQEDGMCEEIEIEENLYKADCLKFFEVSNNVFYEVLKRQIQEKTPCWIGLDPGKFLFRDYGIYDDRPFQLNSILESEFQNIKPKEIYDYKIAMPSHALLLFDTTVIEKNRWWRAQNSVLNLTTNNGNYYLSNSWIRKYVLTAVVNKKYLHIACANKKRVHIWEIFNTI